MTDPLLQVHHLKKYFPVRRGLLSHVTGYVRAVDDVSFDVFSGETLGLVGESGCGKTTIGRCILRLTDPTSGHILFDGKDLAGMDPAALRRVRRDIQVMFQDPFSSLNPRMTIGSIVEEGLVIHGLGNRMSRRRHVADLLERVGIQDDSRDRYPHEFSGGQRQRIGLARALAMNPRLIICDEPVSALDVSVQAQVINLLQELQESYGLTYLFIAHDLSVVQHISTRVAVMYLGKIVETGTSDAVYQRPAHPYTRALLASVPIPDPKMKRKRFVLEGDVPTPLHPPSGCRFHPRCPVGYGRERCMSIEPDLRDLVSGHSCACHFPSN